MLESAEKYERAFAKLIESDGHYFLDLGGESERPPTIKDWANIRELVKFLKIFYDTTVSVSASSHVTSNIYISEVCNLKMIIHEHSRCDNPLLRRMTIDMQRKFDKYWGSWDKFNMLMCVAIVLNPKYKMKFLKHCLTMLFDSDKANDLVRQVENVMERLYLHYKSDLNLDISEDNSSMMVITTSTVTQQSSTLTCNKVHEMFFNDQDDDDDSINQTEVHQYLSKKLEKFSDKIDILAWWKVNSLKFPLLSKIARDVLVILISTVTSESAFSNGGRVLDSFHSSLSPKTVEALICTQSWIRTAKHQFTNFNSSVANIDEIEQDFTSTNEDEDILSILVE